MFYYQHHIGDYLSHTANLSLLEHGVYLRLLHCYYTEEKPLSGDICRQIGARSEEERNAVAYVLHTYFLKESDDCYRQAGADKRILEFKDKGEKAKRAAEMRWHGKTGADAMQTHSESNTSKHATAMPTINHKPLTNNQLSPHTNNKNNIPGAITLDWVPSSEILGEVCGNLGVKELELWPHIATFAAHYCGKVIEHPGSKFQKWCAKGLEFSRNDHKK